MKFSNLLLTTLFITVFSFLSGAQTMRITGTVVDTSGVVPVKNAVAMAVRIQDSLLLGYARSDADGKFVLTGFEIDTFTLIIDHPDYDDKTYYMFGSAENYEFDIPRIQMPDKAQKLDEVIIYANKNPIYYKGDTLVYVADSFQVAENAVVEDLLKKLPGIEVDENGKIKSQGQDIAKVLVDGDEFFGDDPTIATKNLGAKGVESVQVYEKENEDRGDGEDEKIQVLDLKLKDAYKTGYFGRISGASDFGLTYLSNNEPYSFNSSFYEGEFLFNRFSGKQKVSVFALGSNTPRSTFGWKDIRQFGLDNEPRNGQWWDRGASSGNTSGIPQTLRAGVYYSDKYGKKKKGELTFNYSYYNERLDATSDKRSQYFLEDTTYYTEDYSRDSTANQSHNFNLRFEAPIDSLTKIIFKPNARIDISESNSIDQTSYIDEIGNPTLNTTANNFFSGKGYSFGSDIRLERRFKKKGRELDFRYDMDLDNSKTDGGLLTSSEFIGDTTEIVDQKKKNYISSLNHYGAVTYVEPIGKNFEIEGEYQYDYITSAQEKVTFDRGTGSYVDTNYLYTNDFGTLKQQHWASVKFEFENKKHLASVKLMGRDIGIDNMNYITDTVIVQHFTNFLPTVEYMFKPTVSKRLRLTYRTSSQQPSINDLAPVPDNSNPNSIRIGNPELKPTYSHNLNLMFNTWQALTGRYVWTGGNVIYTDNAFSSSTSYQLSGRSTSQTVNVDGNVFATVFGGAGVPVYKRIIELRPNVNGNYNRYTSVINDDDNVTQTLSGGGGLEVGFKWDSLEFDLTNNFVYNQTQSQLTSNSNTSYTNQSYGFRFKWRLPKGFVLATDGKYTINNQQGEGFYDTEFFVWNAEFSKSFLKTENLVISMMANDILNQNINAARQVNNNVITDNRTTIISRYFLLKATLRFNNNKTKQSDYEGMH